MLTKITGTKLYEQVISQIREMIARGVYQKGDMLPSEKELTLLTGVSRITVREALGTLAELGIIETKKGKGSFVLLGADALAPDETAALERRQYRETFLASCRARTLLEPELARQAALTASDGEIKALGGMFERRQTLSGKSRTLDDFHHAIARIINNPLVTEFVESCIHLENEGYYLPRVRPPEKQAGVAAELNSQHRKIFEAIKRRDGEFAYFYMKEHMQFITGVYESYFARYF